MKILLNNALLLKAIRPFNDLGFVPTMGGIHKGHLSLINKSNKLCKKTIAIFVNPKQFNNKKDLKSYPRNIKKDLKLLKNSNKVDFVIFQNLTTYLRIKRNQKLNYLKKIKFYVLNLEKVILKVF